MRMLLFLATLFLPIQAFAATHVIVAGAGGNDTYRRKFNDWATRLERVLIVELKQNADRIYLLHENPEQADDHRRRSNKESIFAVLKTVAQTHPADEPLFIYLMGHGSHLLETTRLHLPGDDLTMAELAESLTDIPAKPLVVINSAPSSAGMVNQLSGPNRILVTATKNVREQNATEFMEYFLQGLEQNIADSNRDQRISVWEAASQAANLTAGFYTSESLIATEHAILDDNGDAVGTRLLLTPEEAASMRANYGAETIDGALAKTTYLRNFQFPDNVPREWINQYLDLMSQVEDLKQRKSEMSEQAYYQRLETKILEAAALHRKIREKAEP